MIRTTILGAAIAASFAMPVAAEWVAKTIPDDNGTCNMWGLFRDSSPMIFLISIEPSSNITSFAVIGDYPGPVGEDVQTRTNVDGGDWKMFTMERVGEVLDGQDHLTEFRGPEGLPAFLAAVAEIGNGQLLTVQVRGYPARFIALAGAREAALNLAACINGG